MSEWGGEAILKSMLSAIMQITACVVWSPIKQVKA